MHETEVSPQLLAASGHKAHDHIAVAVHKLGNTVDHHVGPQLQRALEVRRHEGVVDSQQNLTLNVQSGPTIVGNRLTWNTSNKSTGQVDIYATGNATKNNFNIAAGENVGGATGSVSIMELERDTSQGSHGQKLATLHCGIIMDGVGSTTNNNAFRSENAITFNNGTANGTALIHKIGNTGGENLVHIAGRNNNGADLNGIYSVVRIGRDSANKMQADYMWTSARGSDPDNYTIWNKNVASSFGVVTSVSSTYSLDGDGDAEAASQYQMNAKFFLNRPIDGSAGGGNACTRGGVDPQLS